MASGRGVGDTHITVPSKRSVSRQRALLQLHSQTRNKCEVDSGERCGVRQEAHILLFTFAFHVTDSEDH